MTGLTGVDFGIDRRRGKNRMVAVPYRASDVPAERAEFAHPDVLICLTCISYYNDGLDEAQVKEAVGTLLNLGPAAQRDVYNEWFELSKDGMSPEERSQLDDVGKLDLDNGAQFQYLMKSYRLNMRTINFWLRVCVLPRETKQFPSVPKSSTNLAGHGFK